MNNLQREIWYLLDDIQPLTYEEIREGLSVEFHSMIDNEVWHLCQSGLIIREGHGYRFTTKEEEDVILRPGLLRTCSLRRLEEMIQRSMGIPEKILRGM